MAAERLRKSRKSARGPVHDCGSSRLSTHRVSGRHQHPDARLTQLEKRGTKEDRDRIVGDRMKSSFRRRVERLEALTKASEVPKLRTGYLTCLAEDFAGERHVVILKHSLALTMVV